MTKQDAIEKIEMLIAELVSLSDEDYIEALEEMEERAKITREAFQEDMEKL